MNTQQRSFAVVTGGSSGIGRELAKRLASDGCDLLIIAEDGAGLADAESELQALGAQVQTCEADLGTPEGVERAAAAAGGRGIDVLCLNAGIGLGGVPFIESELDKNLRMIDVIVRSTVHLARLLVPGMAARGSGRILITSSIAGLMSTPYETVYGATKAFDKSFAAALRYELKDAGVTVTTLMPGPTETNFFHRAEMDNTSIGSNTEKQADPADVAKQAIDALMGGKHEVIAGPLTTKFEGVMAKVVPEEVTAGRHGQMAAPNSAEK